MKRKGFYFIFVCVLFFVLSSCSSPPTEEEAEKKGKAFFEAVQTEDLSEVIANYGDLTWKEKVTPEDLQQILQVDADESMKSAHMEAVKQTGDGKFIIDGHVMYETSTADFRLQLTKKLTVSSLEVQDPVAYMPMPNTIVEEDVTVGEGTDFPLDGKLTLPKDISDSVPAVVLVHGSGPADFDETVYGYKPFRDIAWGLAERGIASIRYDKRTYVYGNKAFSEGTEKVNVQEETIDDALEAFNVLINDERIHPKHVYITGHSLGGMLAPRMASEDERVAGIISLAGSPRSMTDIIFDQQELLLEEQDLPETIHQQQQEEIDGMKEETKTTLSLPEEEIISTQLLGMPAYYFWEMEQHPVEEILPSLHIPMYFLQGDEDFQVFKDVDYTLWKELLAGNDQADFSSYKHLNHFFITHDDRAENLLDAYTYPDVVSEEVVDDIAAWIHQQSTKEGE